MLIGFNRPIAAEDPHDCRILVAPAQPLAVPRGRLGSEDLRPDAPLLVPLVAPGWKESHVETERIGFRDDPIHVREVPLIGLRRIGVVERRVAICVRHRQTIELRERDGLYHREPESGAIPQISFGVLSSRAVKQFPHGIPQPEERPAGVRDEVPVILRHLQPWERAGLGRPPRRHDGGGRHDQSAGSGAKHRAILRLVAPRCTCSFPAVAGTSPF